MRLKYSHLLYCLSPLLTLFGVICREDSGHIGHTNDGWSLQNSSCDDLNYMNEPFCHITDPTSWSCLKKKALMINITSCKELRPETFTKNLTCDEDSDTGYCSKLAKLCQYVEMCAFADPDFSCDGDYQCAIVKDGVINCTNGEHRFTKNCTSSFLYCRNSSDYSEAKKCAIGTSQTTDFKTHCIPLYENYSDSHSVWYFVEIYHYNNISETSHTLQSTFHSNWSGDVSKLCSSKSNEEDSDKTDVTIIATVTSVCIIACVVFAYGACEGWMRRMKKEQDVKAGARHFWAAFIASGDAVNLKAEEFVSSEDYDVISDVGSEKGYAIHDIVKFDDVADIEVMAPFVRDLPTSDIGCNQSANDYDCYNSLDCKPESSLPENQSTNPPAVSESSSGAPIIEKQQRPSMNNPSSYIAKG